MKGLLSRVAAFAALAAAYGLVCHLMLTFRVAAHEAILDLYKAALGMA